MDPQKEWIKCSAVAIGFYLIVYFLLGYFFFGFLNFWFILILVLFTIADVWGLRWLIQRYGEKDRDNYP